MTGFLPPLPPNKTLSSYPLSWTMDLVVRLKRNLHKPYCSCLLFIHSPVRLRRRSSEADLAISLLRFAFVY